MPPASLPLSTKNLKEKDWRTTHTPVGFRSGKTQELYVTHHPASEDDGRTVEKRLRPMMSQKVGEMYYKYIYMRERGITLNNWKPIYLA